MYYGKFQQLKPGTVQPAGFLKEWLKQQNEGLSSHYTEQGFTALEWNDLPSPTFEADDNKTLYIPLAAWNMPVRLSIVPGIQGEILTWIHHKDSALSPSSKRLVPGLEVSFFYGQHVLCSPNYEIRKGLPKVIIQDL